MKLLAIDYGTKHIGLATSNQKGTIAFTHRTIANKKNVIDILRDIIKKEEVEKIVVGTPNYNKKTDFYAKLETFIATLKADLMIPICTQDELLTSQAAKRQTNQKHSHEIAAMLILEEYIKRYVS